MGSIRPISRTWLWLRILKRLQGTTIISELALVLSAIVDTILFTFRPLLNIQPKSVFAGTVRSKRYGCCWRIRAGTDDIYSVMPEREGDVHSVILNSLKIGDIFIKLSAEYPPACWGDESGLVRNLGWGGSPSRNAPQLAVGYFTDIGANIGYYTVLASKRVGAEGRVISFEPMPETFQYLKVNCQLNDARNVNLIPKAAFDIESTMTLYFNGYYGTVSLKQSPGITTSVETTTLDVICTPYKYIKMIKIDTEGSEYEVLLGAPMTLKKTKYIVVECGDDSERIIELLKISGFNIRKLAFTTYILAEAKNAKLR